MNNFLIHIPSIILGALIIYFSIFDKSNKKLTISILKSIGFKDLPHRTIGRAMIFELGRRRYLSMMSVGEPNEMLFICERDEENNEKVNEVICLYNYDYDGYLTEYKLRQLIKSLEGNRKKWQTTHT